MQLTPFTFFQPGLVLLMGLASTTLPGVSLAGSGLDVNLTANIVNSTCKLTVENGGEIYLPTVMRSWFYNSDNSNRYSPTDEAGGTPFNIHIDNCEDGPDIKQLQFRFSPQSGFVDNQKQVFKNDAVSGAAQNVGIVIFSDAYKTNVLNSDGSSSVIYSVDGQKSSNYLTDYTFYARYQNTGLVSGGIVTSKVLVDVSYE
ncbi:fimbrial-like protein [Citrobacter sp. Cpo090]|uniref:fimbrial-like protein n=1 Tax=Citrobacter sp. Cpo090 TaxID=2985139 RepID=UPI001A1E0CD9|nr:fimbrial-like protein [Citrobacter sp. Cpo090]MDM2845002.1 fimbrial-like protein [Citrobacter sp. Cpo090]